MKTQHSRIAHVFLAAAVALSLPAALLAATPGVIPPQAAPGGDTYGAMSAGFWQWAFSMPVDAHPLTDTADCDTAQPDDVFFLGGTFAATPAGPGHDIGLATRYCTIPAGTRLFFPVVNAECSTLEGNGGTEEELRACAAWLMDHAGHLFAEVDGVPVADLMSYRSQSPLFTFGPLPENALFGLPEGATSPSISDGVHLALAPLAPGQHVIRFGGQFTFTSDVDGFDYTLEIDITYDLTVLPRRR